MFLTVALEKKIRELDRLLVSDNEAVKGAIEQALTVAALSEPENNHDAELGPLMMLVYMLKNEQAQRHSLEARLSNIEHSMTKVSPWTWTNAQAPYTFGGGLGQVIGTGSPTYTGIMGAPTTGTTYATNVVTDATAGYYTTTKSDADIG